MNWVGFWSIYGLAMVKFLVSAFPGEKFQMAIHETWLASFLGAATASAIFYFGSEFVLRYSNQRLQLERNLSIITKSLVPKN